MAIALAAVWLISLRLLKQDLGRASNKPKFRDLLSKSRAINLLSAARLFLFGARDVWFVIALPVYLSSALGWDFWLVGGFTDRVGASQLLLLLRHGRARARPSSIFARERAFVQPF